jgi:MFS family permease
MSNSRHPRVAVLLASSVLARLPLAMLSISLLVHVHRLTGSFAVAGLASGAYIIGRGVSSPLLGRLVDRYGQTVGLVGCAVVSAGLLALIAALPASAPAALLVALAGATGTASPPLAACVRTLLPVLITEPDALTAAYTLETTILELTFIAGPPLALGLATAISTRAPLLAAAAILLGATAAFAAQPASRKWRRQKSSTVQRGAALRLPAIRALSVVLVAVGVVFGAVDVAVAASATAQHTISATGPLLAIWGVGSLIGGILAARVLASKLRARSVTTLIASVAGSHAILILGSQDLAVLAGLLLLAGATISPATGAIYALAGQTAPEGRQTETFAWLLSASATGASIGSAAAGALTQLAGPQGSFALAALAGIIAAATATHGRDTLNPRQVSRSYTGSFNQPHLGNSNA